VARFKFCGLTRGEDIELAGALGASYVGVILTKSPRQVTPENAEDILSYAQGMQTVGVYRRRSVSAILDEARHIGLDVIQLHGHFSRDEIARIRESFDGAVWSVLPVDVSQPLPDEEAMEAALLGDAVVMDTSVAGESGGTGRTFDWERARPIVASLAGRADFILAGGLTPANVAAAIQTLAPAIVDVSSGVELRPGIKDPDLMKAFAEQVRSASIV
jgi:phosphoribosylanthranilate isomerase